MGGQTSNVCDRRISCGTQFDTSKGIRCEPAWWNALSIICGQVLQRIAVCGTTFYSTRTSPLRELSRIGQSGYKWTIPSLSAGKSDSTLSAAGRGAHRSFSYSWNLLQGVRCAPENPGGQRVRDEITRPFCSKNPRNRETPCLAPIFHWVVSGGRLTPCLPKRSCCRF